MKIKMEYSQLFVSHHNIFGGVQRSFENADYILLGVPYDATSTYRTGARLGPDAIRKSSLNLENYSFRTGIALEDLPLHDLGDLHISMDPLKTLERLRLAVNDLISAGKTPAILGGEHTITLGALRGLDRKASKTAVVSFDAHLDVRQEYLDIETSHTTFMRRINEELEPAKIFEVGTRAVCKEELEYAKKTGLEYYTMHQIWKKGIKNFTKHLKKELSNFDHIYLSVDMDVLDPAYAPAVQNPEPEGMKTSTLLNILQGICNKYLLGFDVVEIAPNFDQGTTAIQGAKVVSEILCYLEQSKRE